MSLQTKFRKSKEKKDEDQIQEQPPPLQPPPPDAPTSSSSSQQAITQALVTTAHLANLLPTGTLLAFQLLVPVFTNNGACDAVTVLLTRGLLLLLAASCFLASFTDSFRAPNGQVYYGFATRRGMWLFNYVDEGGVGPLPELTKYRRRTRDWVHAVLSVLVFAAVALRDRNVVSCFYPQPSRDVQEALDIVPLGVGVLCSLLFVVFPTSRHGIGYPVTSGN